MVKTQDSATIKRTLYFFWQITKKRPWPFALGVIATIGFIGMLTYANTYVMSLIVDRIQLGPVGPDQVWEVFGPYIIALILVNVVGQVCSKLQDYAIFKTEINGNYNLARLCFDTLSNQSMTFHTNRFGGSLVSQTTKFMTSYSLLVETTLLSLLPTVIAIVCTIGILAPIVPSYVAVLTVMLVIYIAVAYIMFRKITPLSAAAAAAQNRLSGVLSDSVTNILAVKTYGREDYERSLFTDASLEAMRADSRSMRATIKRGIMTSSLIVVIMSIVSIFTAGGNAWFGISAGTLVMMFTYTYNLTMRFNMINSMLARLNKVFGDASEMTRILDEPRLVSDVPNAPALQVEAGNIDFEHIGFTYEDSANATPVFTDLNLHIPGGQRVGWWANRARARPRSRSSCCAFPMFSKAKCLWMARISRSVRSKACAVRSLTCRRRRCSFTAAFSRTSPTANPMQPAKRSLLLRKRRTRSNSSSSCPTASTRWWGNVASSSPVASANASRSRALFWPMRPSSCWTRLPARSTPKARRSCRMRWRTSCKGARPLWWHTVFPPWPRSIASWCWTTARSSRTARTQV